MVPYYQPQSRALHLYSSGGQGGTLGYPRFPDEENLAERMAFVKFRDAIDELLTTVPAALADTFNDIAETEEEYPA